MNPLISIIIPTYNRAHLISETLDSIAAQTYINWECIVVDDGSTDDTAAVLVKYIEMDNRFQYYQRPESRKKGPNSCRNYGFEISKGEYINWFDSDDVMLATFLEKQIISIGNNADVSVCKLMSYDFDKGVGIKENEIYSDNLIEDYFCGRISLYISGPFWARRFLTSKSVLFNEDVINCDDWDFNMRMLYFKPKCKFVNQSLILYRIHSDSFSFGILNNNFIEVKKVSNLLDEHLVLIKNIGETSLNEFYKYVISFNRYHLLQSILVKNSIQFFLFKKICKYCFKSGFLLVLFKTIMGKISFSLFGKGEMFFK